MFRKIIFLLVIALQVNLSSAESNYDEKAVEAAKLFSHAFVVVASKIRSSVVNIRIEKKVAVEDLYYKDELFSYLPKDSSLEKLAQSQQPSGTGVIVDKDKGYIITNNHVINGAAAIIVKLADGRVFDAELVGADSASDLAVLSIKADNLQQAEFGDSDAVEVGEWVIAVGNPFGFDFTVTTGIVSARGRSGVGLTEIEDYIQTDAAINQGNSGGPLVNLDGKVIGINSGIYTKIGEYRGIGFAIPAKIVKTIMQSLIDFKKVTWSYLGVETEALTPEEARHFGLPVARGALIKAVKKNSPGDKGGLKRGDVIIRWGQRDIIDNQQLRNLVILTKPGETVDVGIIRAGKPITLSITVVATPDEVILAGRGLKFLYEFGIMVEDLNADIKKYYGYSENIKGVFVYKAIPGSSAYGLGLTRGCIILNIDGEDVYNVKDLLQIIGKASRKNEFSITWQAGREVRSMVLITDN